MNRLLVAVVVAAAVLVAAPPVAAAPAPTPPPVDGGASVQTLEPSRPSTPVLDEQFLGDLARAGIRITDASVAVAGAHDVRAYLVAGAASKYRTLTADEMFAILDHDCRDRHLWALALYGLRRGEIAGLRWVNVDLKAKTVSVVENRVAVGKEVMVGTPKSKASNRALPMPDEVVEVLRAAT
jgi:integrase